MTIRRSKLSFLKSRRSRKRRADQLRQKPQRQMRLEPLEQRQLLAIGPQLAGIQPNDGALLRDGQVRDVAPRELIFHFNDSASIDETTLSGVRLTRAGGDGQFEHATASTDFNTNGNVIVDFRAVRSGDAGNDISIVVIKNALGDGAGPAIDVLGGVINVELNTTQGSQTTASQLVDALNDNPLVTELLRAEIRGNRNAGTDIATPAINYSPIVTTGANAAKAESNLSVGSLRVQFVAVQSGPAGNGIEVVVNRRDFGGVSPPRVTVIDQEITVEVNSNSASPSTAQELVNAINNDVQASALITADVIVGDPNTQVGNRVTGVRLPLVGVRDIPIVPGFLGLGDSPRQVVMRFADPLPDDLYHVEIVGTGPFALRNEDGAAFGDATDDGADDGASFGLDFELDLGAQIRAVIPQPITRNIVTGVLSQARNQVHVYFNDDDLHDTRVNTGGQAVDPTVVDPDFYQLIFTNDTVQNTDDTVYHPTAIQYDPVSDLAVLVFDEPLDELVDPATQIATGPGTFRLRIGTDEATPLPPVSNEPAVIATDLNTSGEVTFEFRSSAAVGNRVTMRIISRDFGNSSPPTVDVVGQHVTIELNSSPGDESTAQQLLNAINSNFAARSLISVAAILDDPSVDLDTIDIATAADPVVDFSLGGVGFASSSEDFNTTGADAVTVDFRATADFAERITIAVTKRDFGAAGAPTVTVVGQHIAVELNTNATNETTAQQLVNAINGDAAASSLVTAIPLADDPSTDLSTVDIATPADDTTTLTLSGVGSSFDTATQLGTLGAQGQIITSAIEAQAFDLNFPGAIDEPGRRQLRLELEHGFGTGGGIGLGSVDVADSLAGITTLFYNFQDAYGFDPLGNVLHNAITEEQKDRTREIFTLLGEHLGVTFVETPNFGMTIATGDLRALVPDETNGAGGVISAFGPTADFFNGRVVMDVQDFSNPGDSALGQQWFLQAMGGILHLLGIGFTDETPPITLTHSEQFVAGQANSLHPLAFPENTTEPVFPGPQDIFAGQHLFRPEGKDIDLYQFQLAENGRFSAEIFAERLGQTSLLDSVLTLYREGSGGERELIARNDDYYSNDAYFEMNLIAGNYWIGVTASGNDNYDPIIDDTGLGGRSEGTYQLRVNFRPDADRTIVDATGIELDGDADGVPGGVYNTWLRAQDAVSTLYVDKAARNPGNGSLATPFDNIGDALAFALPGDVVRIVANGGADGLLETLDDNLAYEIGFNRLGTALADGSTLEVPRGVTVMVDPGAIMKMRRARIGVGSSTSVVDRSGGALQLLGTPRLLDRFGSVVRDADGEPIPGSVYLTSIHDAEIGVDTNSDLFPPDPAPGDWGGVLFQRDIDQADANRFDYEQEGIFLNVVNHADIRFGGGNVVIDGLPQVVTPIHMTGSRPSVMFNSITSSADAAMSASPNSFEETNFHSPPFQFTPFTSDYDRVGPDIHGNSASDNSLNGIFVRVETPAGNELQPMTVSGRWDDTDVPHVLADRLVIEGTAGGAISETDAPAVQLVTTAAVDGGTLVDGTYNYRIVFVDADGNEGLASNPSRDVDIAPGSSERSVRLGNLPEVTAGFVSRRIYRSDKTGNSAGNYTLVGELNATSPSFVDTGGTLGGLLQSQGFFRVVPRLDARLSVDPGVVVKFNGGALETTFGADFYAEGADGREVVFTSVYDDRYGGGGSFDTTDDGALVDPQPGDWGGIRIGPATRASIDHGVIAFGGGLANIEGTFTGFNALEIDQSPARVTRSVIQNNASGIGGQAGFDRAGRGFNREAAVFVRGAQPVIVDNSFLNNTAPAISINANSLDHNAVTDGGRSTYGTEASVSPISIIDVGGDNRGPLVRLNRLGNNDINGMQVRGETLATQSVWDDTDIVHVLRDETVYVPDMTTFGGLRLQSSTNESLVVKLEGADAGITATGLPLDVHDRIGGALQIVGQPRHPVILTGLSDDTAGAGFAPDGTSQVDTNNDGVDIVEDDDGVVLLPTGPEVDNGVLIDDDVPVSEIGHFEIEVGSGGNAISSGSTVQGINQFVQNADFVFDYTNFVDVGSDGGAVDLATTTVTSAAQLIAPDLVASEGTFAGENDVIRWRMESRFDNGIAKFVNTLTLDSDDVLGDLQFITYLDEDVFGNIDDILYPFGTPGSPDFRAFTLDGPERFGFAHGGTYAAGSELVNATYDGWAADVFPQLRGDITGAGTTYTVPGNISTGLPGFLDPSLGQVFGPNDITTGFAWSVDPNATTAVITSFLELIPQDPVGLVAGAGDWGSIRLDQYAHDRNVEVASEEEPASLAAPGNNASPVSSEFLGTLAPNEKSGDDNLRLGFEVHGHLSDRNDIDVYSFNGIPGTEVWIDIDRTSIALDSVVELIDADGQVLARSDNSAAEIANPDLLFESPQINPDITNPDGRRTVNPLRKAGYDRNNPDRPSELEIEDVYTTNSRDAGMRVVLPGQPGQATAYHVRVRSSSPTIDDINAGLTEGNYQLQVRLREADEFPGSTVRFSDIRFATNGIEVLGQPHHSPLLGEAAEIESYDPLTGVFTNGNDTQATAQEIGNLLATDRGALSIAGDISEPDDVDWYRFEIDYELTADLVPNDHFATIFDIDYADGLARANTALWVFNSDGELILRSTGSNIADDRPTPGTGSGVSDLGAGSVGTLDPFIGPVEMPAGPLSFPDGLNDPTDREVYFVAVSSNAQMPDELRQFLEPNPPNPLLRLEPVNSLNRITEDRIDGLATFGGVIGGGSATASPPEIPVLLDPVESVVPFTLGDVSLFVSSDIGFNGPEVAKLQIIDAFTGDIEASVGDFQARVGDIAMRGDGNLFGYTVGPDFDMGRVNDMATGRLLQIDTATATATVIGDDGVGTFRQRFDPNAPGTPEMAGFRNEGSGMSWDAMAFQFDSDSDFFNGFAAGSRSEGSDPDTQARLGIEFLENTLYHFNIDTGVITNSSPGTQDRMSGGVLRGAGNQRIEFGEIQAFTKIVPLSPDFGDTFTVTINGRSISYTASAAFFATEEEVVAGLAAEWTNAAQTIPEFGAFEVLNSTQGIGFIGNPMNPLLDTFGRPDQLWVRLVDPAFADVDIQVSTVNGGGFAFQDMIVEGFGPGGQVKGMDFINGTLYAVTDRGGLFEVNLGGGGGFFGGGFFGGFSSSNLATYVQSSAADLMTGDNGQPIQFAGLTAGPPNVEGGKYADMLFGIDTSGELFAFNTAGELQPIFVDNQTSVNTGVFGANGIAFSTLDRNLWQTTTNRGNDVGHGTNGPGSTYEPFDHSRLDVTGGDSFYFGNDRSTNVGGNQSFSNTAFVRNYDFPDGAHGSLISNPFSLKGYAPADQPVLYFNYFLETEGTEYDPTTNPITPTRDSLRVFGSGDNGEWTLLATNNTFQDAVRTDEFEYGVASPFGFELTCEYPEFDGTPCVQPLFDNTGGWRQARIPLAAFAGQENLRLRFDFATAGSMEVGSATVGSELRTRPGAELSDGFSFQLDGSTTLEFDSGFTLVAPTGAAISDGDSFNIDAGFGQPTTFEFDADDTFQHDLNVSTGIQYQDGDSFRVDSGTDSQVFEFDSGASILVPPQGGIGIPDQDTFEINGVVFEFDDDGSFSSGNNIIDLVIDQGLQIPFAGGGAGGIADGESFRINNGIGGSDQVFEFDSDDQPTNPNVRNLRLIDTTNVELQIPIAGGQFGGIQDGESFNISDGTGGLPTVFEFDSNNQIQAGSRVVTINDTFSQNQVANAIVGALQVAGLGLQPVNLGGGIIRMGIFQHDVDVTDTPTIRQRTIPATQTEIANRTADIILNAGLRLTPTIVGNGTVRLGSTTHVVDTTDSPSVTVQTLRGSQQEMADLIRDAIVAADPGVSPLRLGVSEIFLGQTTSLDTTASVLTESGSPGTNDPTAEPVVITPNDTADEVAVAVSAAIDASGLGLTTAANGSVVVLPAGVSFSPSGSAITPAGVSPVQFDTASSASGIASSIAESIRNGFSPPQTTIDLTAEPNDRLTAAADSGLTGGAGTFQASGVIGDNLAYPFERGLDVDIVELELEAGDRVLIEASAQSAFFGPTLTPAVRFFDARGLQLDVATGGFGGFGGFGGGFGFTPAPARIDFTAITPGTYYAAVSGSSNLAYDEALDGSADVTLVVPPQGGALGGLSDGETFTIDDGSGNPPTIFEFDSDGQIRGDSIVIDMTDLVLGIPAEGVNAGGIQDGDTFTINNNLGSGDIVFEFDTVRDDSFNTPLPGTVFTQPGNIGIFIDPFFDTVFDIVTATEQAIRSANLGLNTQSLGNNTIILGTDQHTVDITDAPALTLTNSPRTQADITNRLSDAIRTSGLGLAPQASTPFFSQFGFFGGFGSIDLDIRDHTIDTTLAPNLGKIIPTDTGAYDLSIEVVNPFNIFQTENRINLPDAVSVTPSGLPATFVDGQPGVSGGFTSSTPIRINSSMTAEEVATATADGIGRATATYIEQILAVNGSQISDGEIFSIGDGTTTVNFEFENGYSLQIPDPAANPLAFLDGESFTISRGAATTRFEFDDNSFVSGGGFGIRFNDVILEVPVGGMSEDVNQNGLLDLDEDLNFNGILDPGEDLNNNGVLDFSEDLNFNGRIDGAIFDGDTFSIDRGPGSPTTVFEFDTDGNTTFGNEVISVSITADEVAVANAMIATIIAAGIDLDPKIVGRGAQGNVGFGGFGGFFTQTTVLVGLGVIDHNVDIGGTPSLNSSLALRNQDEVADVIVRTIGGAGVGMSPTHLGNGLIHLGGLPDHVVDISNAVTLSISGLPGPADPASVVIPVFPGDAVSPEQVASLIFSAIDTAQQPQNQGLRLGVARSGTRRINLSPVPGAELLTDFSHAPSLPINRSGSSVSTYDNIVRVVGHTVSNAGPNEDSNNNGSLDLGEDFNGNGILERPLGLETSLAGDDPFGAFDVSQFTPTGGTANYPGVLRGLDNDHEGVYIDDVVIGFAERGEMVIGAAANPAFIQNPELFNLDLPISNIPHNEIHSGPYQLEIRAGQAIGFTVQDPDPELFLLQTFNTNERLTDAVSFTVPAGHELVDGGTFTISDGLNSLTFEFNDLALNNGTQSGRIAIGFRSSDRDTDVARNIRDIINGVDVQAVLDISAALSDGVATGDRESPGFRTDGRPFSPPSTSNRIDLFGNASLSFGENTTTRNATLDERNDTLTDAIDTGIGSGVTTFVGSGVIGDNPTLFNPSSDVDLLEVSLSAGQTLDIRVDAQTIGSGLDAVINVFEADGSFAAFDDDSGQNLDPLLQYTARSSGTHYIGISGYPAGAVFLYDPRVEGSAQGGSLGFYTVTLTTSGSQFGVVESRLQGDENVTREQGQILIHSNRISGSLEFGIRADAAIRDGAGQTPHIGPTRVTRDVNVANLVPGVTIANNVIARNQTGGIHFSGDPVVPGTQVSAMPFGRIVNNTIVGAGVGVGIQVDENASPTILNNIVAETGIGVSIDATSLSTVLGGTVYQGNTQDTNGVPLGSFAIELTDPADPLFVDTANDNFYLAPGSRAIDSSIDSLEDRPELVTIKSPLGLGMSPILAPDLDAIGQTRVDDPEVDSPPGQGASVFKDRGALDRADFAGPTVALVNPRDNDALGNDTDPRNTFIELTNQVLSNFSIQLIDGIEPDDPQDGTGADDSSVRADRVSVFRDGEKLEEGVDYKFAYDATNNVIRLTPLAGIWEVDRVYTVELSNARGTVISAPNGTEVADGDTFDITDEFGNLTTFEFDSGYAVQVPQTFALQIPAQGGNAFSDGQTFTVTKTDTNEFLTFEFDRNGFVPLSNIAVPFAFSDSANDIANSLVTAISTTQVDLELAPVNIVNFGGRAVHLGTNSTHDVDLGTTPLTLTGQAGGVEDGQSFTIDDGTKLVEFAFSSGAGTPAAGRVIPFTFDETNEQIADSIADAIIAAGVALNPNHHANSDGLIHLGGTTRHVVDVTNSTLTLTGLPGATPAFGIQFPTLGGQIDVLRLLDGETFDVSNGALTVTFEMDDDGNTVGGNTPIQFSGGIPIDRLSNNIAIAIRDASLGLSPANSGGGVITLNGGPNHSVDLTNSSFVELGTPGVAPSEPVPYVPGDFFEPGVPARNPIFVEQEMAISIAASINDAAARRRLVDVVATARDEEVGIEGVASVGGLGLQLLSNITDIAGNALKPNRSDGSSAFTIFVGSGNDYGDAPQGYPVRESENGARHVLVGDFFLGAGVDSDFDGVPSDLADSDDNDGQDDEDGIVFTTDLVGGFDASIDVTASAGGLLDAWIDYDRDMQFETSEKLVFQTATPRPDNSMQLVSGSQTLTFQVNGSALPGDTAARFRFSSRGGLAPVGTAEDGEVEDYIVTIQSNPHHNAANPFDVDGTGHIVPLDVLLVINELNRNGGGVLAPPGPSDPPPCTVVGATPCRPLVDVNGNGSLEPLDVLLIINEIVNADGNPEGEASLATTLGDDFFTTAVVDHRVDSSAPQSRSANNALQFATPDTSPTDQAITAEHVESADAAWLDEDLLSDLTSAFDDGLLDAHQQAFSSDE